MSSEFQGVHAGGGADRLRLRSGSPVRDYLQLVRLPNLFTAVADVAMGFFVAQPLLAERRLGMWEWAALGTLAAASVLLYAAGVVLNDWFDLEIDRQERPERPLPSGRIAPCGGAAARLDAALARRGRRLRGSAGGGAVSPRHGSGDPSHGDHRLRCLAETNAAGPIVDGRLPDAQRDAWNERRRGAAPGRAVARGGGHRGLRRRHHLARRGRSRGRVPRRTWQWLPA